MRPPSRGQSARLPCFPCMILTLTSPFSLLFCLTCTVATPRHFRNRRFNSSLLYSLGHSAVDAAGPCLSWGGPPERSRRGPLTPGVRGLWLWGTQSQDGHLLHWRPTRRSSCLGRALRLWLSFLWFIFLGALTLVHLVFICSSRWRGLGTRTVACPLSFWNRLGARDPVPWVGVGGWAPGRGAWKKLLPPAGRRQEPVLMTRGPRLACGEGAAGRARICPAAAVAAAATRGGAQPGSGSSPLSA